jgi:hypothetical protein
MGITRVGEPLLWDLQQAETTLNFEKDKFGEDRKRIFWNQT